MNQMGFPTKGGLGAILLVAAGAFPTVLIQAIPSLVPSAVAVTHSVRVSRLTPSSTARRGGPGGGAYNLSCPEGAVLTGIGARSGSLIDQVQGICQPITATGNWTGAQTRTATAGGPGGNATMRLCPANFAVSGFSGRASNLINQLSLECTRLAANGTLNTNTRLMLGAVGGSGGSAFNLTRCSRPARAIVGGAGIYVDSFELACETNVPEITTAVVDSALSGATGILRTDSGAADVACDVNVRRSGRVNIEPSNGLWNVSSASELDAACNLPGFTVVTDRITYCSGIGSNIVGCARPGCMVVVPVSGASALSQLWAHEFGHTRALPHRNGAGNIMNDTLNNGNRINTAECDSYLNPVLSYFFAFLPEQESQKGNMTLDEFVSQTFIHGMPYDQAVAYGPQAVPQLISILRNPSDESKWSNASTMLAMIGDPTGVDAVIEFIDKVNPDDPRSARAWARGNALLALGYSAARADDQKALRYLTDSMQPDAWRKRQIRGARGSARASGSEVAEIDEEDNLDDELTEYAAIGLALSGRVEARQTLEAYAGAPGRSAHDRDMVANLLPEHAKISKRGVAAYDFDRRARAKERVEAEDRARRRVPMETPDVPKPPKDGPVSKSPVKPSKVPPGVQ